MEEYRKIEFRSSLFDGYNIWIDISRYNNTDDLVNDAKKHLVNFLKTFNLKSLEVHATKTQFMLGMFTTCPEIIKHTTTKDIIYVYANSNMILP